MELRGLFKAGFYSVVVLVDQNAASIYLAWFFIQLNSGCL